MTLEEIQRRAVDALADTVPGPEALILAREAVQHCLLVLDGIRRRTEAGDPPTPYDWQLAMSEVASRVGSIPVLTALFCYHAGLEMEVCADAFLATAESDDPLFPT